MNELAKNKSHIFKSTLMVMAIVMVVSFFVKPVIKAQVESETTEVTTSR